MRPSLNPFPRLFDVFLVIYCYFFFLRVFASFENNVQMKIFPASFPHTIWCFSDYFFCCFLRVLPVLRTMCRWTSSLHPFPILIDFFRVFASFENNLQMKTFPTSFPHTIWFFSWLFIVFFSWVFASFENNLQMKTFPASFPHTIGFFSDYFLLFSQGFASFEKNLQMKTFPTSFPHTICFFFLIIYCFFLEFLPVLRTICRWKPSLPPFPILLEFFWLFFAFFSGFCQFWDQSANENLPYILSPYYLMFFWLSLLLFFFVGFLPVLSPPCILSSYYLIFFWLFFEPWFCLHYFLLFWFVFLLIFYFGLNPCFLESVEFCGSQR